MMINPNSLPHLRVPFPQYGQTDPGQIRRYITENSGLQQDLQEVQGHFRVRHDDLFRMSITESGTPSGAKPALDDAGKVQTDIRGDLKNMCATNQAPRPVDVTA
ncbi:MAG: hypothetical protein LAN83_08875 [Acidobacteriia bacterium]|nr:hypothetical protein [Terriglobia bacterium]